MSKGLESLDSLCHAGYGAHDLFSLSLSLAVLSLAKGEMFSGAACTVLRCGDRERFGVLALAEHRVPRLEAGEHSVGYARTHHPHRLRPVQGEHRT